MSTDNYIVIIKVDKPSAGQHKTQYNASTMNKLMIVIVADEFNSHDTHDNSSLIR